MSDATPVHDDEKVIEGETFFHRLSRRKHEARLAQIDADEADAEQADDDAKAELTDADMPPIESLSEDSDYSAFLSSKVSESLRRMALRKLFHSSAFNVIDDMDDYAEDFTTFQALGDIITADMRHQMEVEAEKERAEALHDTTADAASDDDNDIDSTDMPEDDDELELASNADFDETTAKDADRHTHENANEPSAETTTG